MRTRHPSGVPEPRSLWADPAAREPHRGWFERLATPQDPAPHDPGTPPPARNRWRIAFFTLLALAALAGAALAGAATSKNDAKPRRAAPGATGGLPAGRTAALYRALAPGVVQVRSSLGSATGFVVRDTGTIVTDLRVVKDATNLQVVFDDPANPVTARALGVDEASGLAGVNVSPSETPGLKPLALADSGDLKVADPVLALSYRRGLDRSITTGIVSGLGSSTSGGAIQGSVVQTDATGDRGAPLVNATGLVVGVLTRAPSKVTGNVALAVPADTVQRLIPELETAAPTAPVTGPSTPATAPAGGAYIGVSVVTSPSGTGALIQEAVQGGPAALAGLEGVAATGPGGGDTILAVETARIRTPDDLIKAVATHQPGDVVSLLVERAGQRFNVDVTLEARPTGSP